MTKLVINTPSELSALNDSWSAELPKFPISIEIKEIGEKAARTIPQNNSIRLYCSNLAKALNEGGCDMEMVFRAKTVSVPWSRDKVLEALWRDLQEALFNTRSTTKLKTDEVSRVYDVLNRHISTEFGVSVEFPDRETLRLNQEYGSKK